LIMKSLMNRVILISASSHFHSLHSLEPYKPSFSTCKIWLVRFVRSPSRKRSKKSLA